LAPHLSGDHRPGGTALASGMHALKLLVARFEQGHRRRR